MKKLFYITVAAILITLSSCAEEEIKVEQDGQGRTQTSENQF